MTDIFLSYKAEDRPRVRPLVDALKAAGHEVWWDARIGGGENWRESIAQQLDAAKCVVVAWSERSVGPEGRFVRDEAGVAQESGRYLPITIDPVRPPLGFREVQAIDLSGWDGNGEHDGFVALLSAIETVKQGRHLPSAERASGQAANTGPSRRTVIGGGAALAAVAAVGGYALLRPTSAKAGRIVILPFSNLSGGGQDYFADGLAEELRGALSRAGLEVIGRTSTEAVAQKDTATIVKSLGVSHILTGSVRRSDEKMRVSAQLIAGKDGVQAWAENYDRAVGDAIRVQSDIAERVATALSVAVGVLRKAVEIGGTNDPVAQDYVLQGAELLRVQGLTKEVLPTVIALNRKAIERDPKYARAVLSVGQLQASYAGQFASDEQDGARWLADAERTIRHGVALAPGFGPGYAALADLDRGSLRYPAALAGFRKAIELAPTTSNVLVRSLNALPWIGTLEEAEQAARAAVSLDPLSPTAFSLLTLVLRLAGRLDEAITAGRKAVELSPTNANALTQLAYTYIDSRDHAAALRTSQGLSDGDFNRPFVAGAVAAKEGRQDGVDQAIAELRKMFADYASYQYAQIYALAGKTEPAFAALTVAERVKDPGLMSTMRDPYLRSLRADERFAALVRRLNFPIVDPGIGAAG
ncbi:TIR domain-containing protein [Sphingomonas sp. BN140010]|uniref:TIR domain-containing protein n=1 Tax=Sphingomonas arvum TaxID=2992113 RepID=A0ABT3JHL7_9SPHN|nr:TIR domain-containing protein [Sphingomonas sp. BN140010]MCW3798553.1 TIR domain-containing protein [Sphingomonas sp. BN140010]